MPIQSTLLRNNEESPHEPGVDENWQESFIISVWDTTSDIYLFIRLSQLPNREQGIGVFSLSLWTPDYVYKNTQDAIPLRPGDRGEHSLVIGDGLCKYEFDGRFNWSIRDVDVAIQLSMTVEDLGDIEQANSSMPVSDVMARMHKQAVGAVTGYVAIKGKKRRIDGKGWRDHSWGPRKWLDFRVHRAFIAMFDEELTAYFYSVILESGEMNKNALIITEGKASIVEDCQSIGYMADDGISICGGQASFRLEDKDTVIHFDPLGDASISMIHGFADVNLLCKVRMGDKYGIGFCDISSRPQGGVRKPYLFPSSPAYIENGLVAL